MCLRSTPPATVVRLASLRPTPRRLVCAALAGRAQAVAEATGVVLDPVYSGKAVHALLQEMRDQPEAWANRK